MKKTYTHKKNLRITFKNFINISNLYCNPRVTIFYYSINCKKERKIILSNEFRNIIYNKQID